MEPLDFTPSTTATREAVAAVSDDQLGGPTPCRDYRLGDLVEHVGGLADAFVHAARKQVPPGEMRDGDASQLGSGWRERIDADLAALAEAWAKPSAYEGVAMAGPVGLPATEVAMVALNEVVVHGWDVAVSIGRAYRPDPAAVAWCLTFVEGFDAPANDDGGLFGPPVRLGAGASPFDRLLALTGRDPGWRPDRLS